MTVDRDQSMGTIRNLVIVSVAGAGIAIAVSYRWPSADNNTGKPTSDAAAGRVGPPIELTSNAVHYPPALGGNMPNGSQSGATNARLKIGNQKDLYLASIRALEGGTPDEQLAAAEIAAGCSTIARTARMPAGDKREKVQKSVTLPGKLKAGRPVLSTRETEAIAELTRRCAGFDGQSLAEIQKHADALRRLAASGTSPLVTVRKVRDQLLRSGRSQLDDDQNLFVHQALLSNDPVLVKEALWVVHASIDPRLPDGRLRRFAFETAMTSVDHMDADSAFDRLVACASRALCDDVSAGASSHAAWPHREQIELERLTREYRNALSSGANLRVILTIR